MCPTAATAERLRPRESAFDHDEAMRLASTEYQRVVELFEELTPADWTAATECPGWDVRAMAGHMLGMTQMAASLREMASQQRAGNKRAAAQGCLPLDGLTAIQVDRNAGLSTDELVAAMRERGPAAAKARARTPGFIRHRTLPGEQRVGEVDEPWTLGFLLDTILTRDPFLHRYDIARATGRPMRLEADHEGRIVADVVDEWADRHGQPYVLELTGPAGGSWREGDAEPIRMDAMEFCRTLSGRAPGQGLLAVAVPF
ncbi:maleylpyruvate isomerase family mycothiol-dependent enzyme [Nocardioides sp.]|uniref:maleylpyruvate isomerase family mycothiol-dependent enzyme n=1 Tax=Nocardioides sp. TaxID=35761 RepID=UPI0035649A09